MPTIEEFVRRDAERLMESDPEYMRAKRAVQEAEDELMSMLTLEPAMAFVLYEERREKLEGTNQDVAQSRVQVLRRKEDGRRRRMKRRARNSNGE